MDYKSVTEKLNRVTREINSVVVSRGHWDWRIRHNQMLMKFTEGKSPDMILRAFDQMINIRLEDTRKRWHSEDSERSERDFILNHRISMKQWHRQYKIDQAEEQGEWGWLKWRIDNEVEEKVKAALHELKIKYDLILL